MGKPMYAIIGIKKLKSYGNVKGVLSHMTRERETLNSNGRENDILIEPMCFEDIKEEIQGYLPRKNAVLAYDILLASSPEFFDGKTEEEIRQWEAASLLWAQDKFGRESVLGCICHRDETSPHLSLLVLPLHDGKLNARYYTGGRAKMRELWTSYAEAMRPFGLERGKEYSPAKHKDIKEYYADINQSNRRAKAERVTSKDLPSPRLRDYASPKEYAAACVNTATLKLQRENAHLLQENNNLMGELYDAQGKLADIRKASETMKENPTAYAEMSWKLEEAQSLATMAYEQGRRDGASEGAELAEHYEQEATKMANRLSDLETATIKFFDECVGRESVLRFTDKAPRYYKSFPEVYAHVTSHALGMKRSRREADRTRTRERE